MMFGSLLTSNLNNRVLIVKTNQHQENILIKGAGVNPTPFL